MPTADLDDLPPDALPLDEGECMIRFTAVPPLLLGMGSNGRPCTHSTGDAATLAGAARAALGAQEEPRAPVPVTLITGFLGAGKVRSASRIRRTTGRRRC